MGKCRTLRRTGGAATLVFVVSVKRSNTILYTDRWREMVEFYRHMLGWAVAFENEWFVEFAVSRDTFVSVADARRSTIAPGRGAGITLSFQVGDVQAVRSELLRAGIDVGEVGARWGADVLDVRDPSGNRLEFWAPAVPEVR